MDASKERKQGQEIIEKATGVAYTPSDEKPLTPLPHQLTYVQEQ